MTKRTISIIIVCVTLLLTPFAIVGYSYYNNAVFGNKSETQINTAYKNGRNILGQFTAKLSELAQVRTMAVEDQERLIKAVFGDGGRAGNKAAWQWVQENNPKADMTVLHKLTDVIDASRNKFMNHQTSLLAMCQPYQERIGHPWSGIFLGMAGYPDKRADEFGVTIKKMCTPIESSHSKEAFETGTDDGFKFQ